MEKADQQKRLNEETEANGSLQVLMLYNSFQVYILRWFHFGAILVNLREYTNGGHVPPSNAMNLTRLYIGGLPSHVFAPHLTNR